LKQKIDPIQKNVVEATKVKIVGCRLINFKVPFPIQSTQKL